MTRSILTTLILTALTFGQGMAGSATNLPVERMFDLPTTTL